MLTSAQLAGRAWTVTATAERAGLNPLAYLHAYLDECARAEGSAPTDAALTRFLPWAVSTQDRTAWAADPRPNPTPPSPTPSADPRAGPAPESPTGTAA